MICPTAQVISPRQTGTTGSWRMRGMRGLPVGQMIGRTTTGCREWPASLPIVMAGLDPTIHVGVITKDVEAQTFVDGRC